MGAKRCCRRRGRSACDEGDACAPGSLGRAARLDAGLIPLDLVYPDRRLAPRAGVKLYGKGPDLIAGALDGPFIILFELDRVDNADDGISVEEDADQLGPSLGLAVEPLDRVGRVRLDASWVGKVMQATTSVLASSKVVSFGSLGRSWSVMWRHCARTASASPWAKAVAMQAETTR